MSQCPQMAMGPERVLKLEVKRGGQKVWEEVRGEGWWSVGGSVNMAVVNDMYPLIKASGGYQPSVIPTCLIVD